MQVDESILSCQSFEFVGSCAEVVPGLLLKVLSNLLGKTLKGVKTSADGGTALCDLINILQGLSDTFVTIAQLVDIAGEFLSESQRSGILSMGATDLNYIVKLGPLGIHDIDQALQLGQKSLIDLEDSSDVHN
jgi:hypothetical protein